MAPSSKASAKSAAESADKAAEAFGFGTTDIPVAVREFADRTLDQAREFYSRAKTAAEEANDIFEGTFDSARESAKVLSLKSLDAVKSNADASFDLFKEMLGVKSFADALELQTTFARKQWETMTEQVRDFQETTQKVLTDAAKPGRSAWEKAFAGK
jgi:phasin